MKEKYRSIFMPSQNEAIPIPIFFSTMKASAKTFEDITRAEALTLDISDVHAPAVPVACSDESEYRARLDDYLESLSFLVWRKDFRVPVENLSEPGVHEISVRFSDEVSEIVEASEPVECSADYLVSEIEKEKSHGHALANLGPAPFAAYLAGRGIAKDVAREVFGRFFPVA